MLHYYMLVNLHNYCAMPVQKLQMELPYILDGGQVEVHEYIIMHIPSSTSNTICTADSVEEQLHKVSFLREHCVHACVCMRVCACGSI